MGEWVSGGEGKWESIVPLKWECNWLHINPKLACGFVPINVCKDKLNRLEMARVVDCPGGGIGRDHSHWNAAIEVQYGRHKPWYRHRNVTGHDNGGGAVQHKRRGFVNYGR